MQIFSLRIIALHLVCTLPENKQIFASLKAEEKTTGIKIINDYFLDPNFKYVTDV